MNTVVSDTSPFNYLILIGAIDILPSLFQQVLIPPAVWAELQHSGAPKIVSAWIASCPAWVRIESPLQIDQSIDLGARETEAISLAVERKIPSVLIDERRGWKAAELRGITPVGTINLLEAADARGLLRFEEAIERLGQTNFRGNQIIISTALERIAKRRAAS